MKEREGKQADYGSTKRFTRRNILGRLHHVSCKKKKGAKKGSTASKFRNENEVIPVWYSSTPTSTHNNTTNTNSSTDFTSDPDWITVKASGSNAPQARLLRCWEQRSGRLVFLSAGLIMQNYKHLQLMQTNPGKTKPLLLQQNSARIYSQRRNGAPSIACWPFPRL